MNHCEGRIAIVTGAAGTGMGRSIALTLARAGAAVVVNYRSRAAAAAELVAHLDGRGAQALAVQADVFTPAGCARLVEAAEERFGRVDICIVSPGAGWHPEPPDRLDPAALLIDVEQELAPLAHLLPRLLPGMIARRWGRLIGIAAHPEKRSPAYAYNVAKAARLQALLLAQEAVWQHGITVNVIAPGPVGLTGSLAEAAALCEHQPAWEGRAGVTPQDIAEGVAFLCSDAGRYLGGAVLPYRF